MPLLPQPWLIITCTCGGSTTFQMFTHAAKKGLIVHQILSVILWNTQAPYNQPSWLFGVSSYLCVSREVVLHNFSWLCILAIFSQCTSEAPLAVLSLVMLTNYLRYLVIAHLCCYLPLTCGVITDQSLYIFGDCSHLYLNKVQKY